MITFSDSRQGTARFAIRAQLEAERNFVRSFVYHKLWSRAETAEPSEVDTLREQVEKMAVFAADEALKPIYEQKQRELVS